MELKDRIKLVRSKTGMTMEKFGNQLGVSKSAINLLEKGVNTPSEQSIKAICREFNINEDWLRTGEGEMYTQLGEHEIIMQRLAKVQRASGDEKKNAMFRERLASAILNMDDAGCDAMLKVLEDMGYINKEADSQPQ